MSYSTWIWRPFGDGKVMLTVVCENTDQVKYWAQLYYQMYPCERYDTVVTSYKWAKGEYRVTISRKEEPDA